MSQCFPAHDVLGTRRTGCDVLQDKCCPSRHMHFLHVNQLGNTCKLRVVSDASVRHIMLAMALSRKLNPGQGSH